LFDQERNRQIEELRTKYETEKKEKENEELQREAQLKEDQLLSTRIFLGLSILFAFIAAVLAFIYYKALVQNKKDKSNLQVLHSELQEKNEEVTAQSEELIEANAQIALMNENLESLVKDKASKIMEQNKMLTQYAFQNAHKVRGPLARIMGLINLVRLGGSSEETTELISKIEDASHELDSVVKEINSKLEVDSEVEK
jgi:signal transduction histidine kinase